MKLVVFDVDGTLVDSQHHITGAMAAAFSGAGLPPLPASEVLGIVGLSLPVAVAQLAPQADAETQARIVEGYKNAFLDSRIQEDAPLYPGALACLEALGARDDLLLAVATGKSRRGLDAMIAAHALEGRFVSLQCADDHPSKPHPAMLLAALDQTGISAGNAVMIGDTEYDIEMARAAGVAALGVGWGYHPVAVLQDAGAGQVAEDFVALRQMVEVWADG